MVRGTDIETDAEMSNKPIAIAIGFDSGLARATIFENEALLDLSSTAGEDHGHKFERRFLRELEALGFECAQRRVHCMDENTGFREGIRPGAVERYLELHRRREVPKNWARWYAIFCAPSRRGDPLDRNVRIWSLDGPTALWTAQNTFIMGMIACGEE